jgi:outer membrane lipoprotein-sorting protein
MRGVSNAGVNVVVTLILGALVAAGRPAASQTGLDEVVAKNLAGRGGVEKLRGLETVKGTGIMEARGMELPIATWSKRPNKIRRDQKLPDRTITVAFDGTTVWTHDTSMGGPQRMTGPQAQATREDAAFDPLFLRYKEQGHKVELVGDEKLDGVAVHHLRVTKKDGRVEEHYLNAETGLEFRTLATLEEGGMKAELRSDFSDYREVDGLKVPFSIRQFLNGTPVLNVKLTQIEFNVPVDDAIFAMPAAK